MSDSCNAALYPDRPAARDAQHRISRMYYFSTGIRFCEECNGFHTVANLSRMKLPKRAIEVMRMVAQGFSSNEIATDLGMPKDTVTWYTRVLKERFGALSLSHLIAIAIAVKALSPSEFIPPIVERNHNAGSNGQRIRTGGDSAPRSRPSAGKAGSGTKQRLPRTG